RVLAPKRIAAGKRGAVRVKLGAGALAVLAGRTTTIEVRAVVRQGDGKARTQTLKLRLRRAALADQPGAGNPASGPVGPEPPRLARPLTAVDVSDVQVTWYPRDSWVRYVYSAEGMTPGGGASLASSAESPCPDKPVAESRPYTVHYVAAPSWFDPVSGTAGVYGSGSVNFLYSGHGIDLTAADPEIEINGAASRAIFRMNGAANTPYPNLRVAVLALDTGGQPTLSNGGKTLTYSLMRGRLTEDGVNVFAGFYTAPSNNQFGCVSVSFTTP
ncbi:MAG TPA: HtaA domain-containing protein, partial [Solirubrobacterales bacterium]|nr:HtaA domain-containing protein [Solirubrobacterales bacterium]